MRSACLHGFFRKDKRKKYCVLHYPGQDKEDQFKKAFDEKRAANNFDFSGVWFPYGVSFSGLTLSKASFRESKFNSAAQFGKTDFGTYVDFRGTQFLDVSFQYAKFVTGDFAGASFGRADFLEAEFAVAYFSDAHFNGDAFFNPTKFRERANFESAEFHGKAYFGKGKFDRGAFFASAKFSALADFGEAQFASANFGKARFSDRANFGKAKFGSDVVFQETQFQEASFNKTEFHAVAQFGLATFNNADFTAAILGKSAFFNKAEFGKAYFSETKFLTTAMETSTPGASDGAVGRIVSFDSARFKDTFVFENSDLEAVNLQFVGATVEQPERVTFHNVSLRPIWLARFNSRDLQFIKVRWRDLRSRRFISTEIKALKKENISTPYESLELVCRELADNAEENNRYEEAARFRFIANEARRRERWHNLKAQPRKREAWIDLNPLLWLYGGVSGYGERASQAALVLLLGCVLFASIFFIGQRSGWWQFSKNVVAVANSSSEAKEPTAQAPMLQDFREALLYSANVMALQKPEPLPGNKRAKILVLIETLFGPLQLALLALAIRRKFMR